ncbi:MAG: DUF1844 domain-containing protein [Pirellulaceae bacterium]
MTDEQKDKPRIVVDGDWKEQVQAEKEAARQAAEQKTPEKPSADPLPPASFSLLVSSLATQALMWMGQIPDPEGKSNVQIDHAKHSIDMLGMLEEKTKGNLTPEESVAMDQVLHELRMVYVAVAKTPPDSPDLATPGET